MLFTADGGKSWHRQREVSSQIVINDISFFNDETGWMVGGINVGDSGNKAGVLFGTEDGGLTWRRISTAPASDAINSVRFTSLREGWLTTDYSIYRTHDGGKSWESVLNYPEVQRRSYEIYGSN